MNKKKAAFICFLVWFTGIILLIVADQAAKYWAVSKLKGTSGMTLIPNSQNRILYSTDSGRWYSDRRCGRKFY